MRRHRPHDLLAIRHLYAGVIAGGISTAGILLLITPDAFRTTSLQVAFDTFPPRIWGALFSGSVAWFALFHQYRAAATPMAFAMTAWASMLAWASISVEGASPTAWIWPTCIAVLLLFGIARGDL